MFITLVIIIITTVSHYYKSAAHTPSTLPMSIGSMSMSAKFCLQTFQSNLCTSCVASLFTASTSISFWSNESAFCSTYYLFFCPHVLFISSSAFFFVISIISLMLFCSLVHVDEFLFLRIISSVDLCIVLCANLNLYPVNLLSFHVSYPLVTVLSIHWL